MATCNRTPWGADSRRNGLKVRHGRGLRHLSAGLILAIAFSRFPPASWFRAATGSLWDRSREASSFHSPPIPFIAITCTSAPPPESSTPPAPTPGPIWCRAPEFPMVRWFLPCWLIHRRKELSMPAPATDSTYRPTSPLPGRHAVRASPPVRRWWHWPTTLAQLARLSSSPAVPPMASLPATTAARPGGRRVSGLPASADINALLFEPTSQTLFAAVDTVGIFASSDLGSTWCKRSTGLPQEVHALTSLASHGISSQGPTLYAGTDQGVYASTDDGSSWSVSGTGLRQPVYSLATYVTAQIPGWIYAGTQSDVIRSPNGGHTWATIAPGLSERVLALASVPGNQSNPSSPPYVVFAGAENLWRYPPETSSATGIASLLIEVLVTLFMFGLLFYFVRRARKQWGTPAGAAAGEAGGGETPGGQDASGTPGEVRQTPVRSDLNGHARTPAGGARPPGSENSGKNRRKKQ